MISLAFKIAAATHDPWSELIARESGGPYSHVEGWLSGPQNAAYCFSSREPHGAGFATLDLTQMGLWNIVPVSLTPAQELLANGFCLGCDGKDYDGIGLVGFALKNPAIHDYSRIFCSETWAAIAKKCWSKALPCDPWQVSPVMLSALAKAW